MKRPLQSLFFITGVIFFGVGQVFIWNTSDKLVPYLLNAIIMILIAMYLREDK